MKSLSVVLPLLLSISSLAVPTGEQQVVLGGDFTNILGQHKQELKGLADQFLDDAQRLILKGKKNLDRWIHDGREYIKQNGLMYELVESPHLKNYKLRITEPTLCDPSVKQFSGYLDIAEDKSLFFWFFESRSSPSADPLVLWINGGPGCSSSTGLLFELGPCNIANEGRNTTYNPYSWNTNANMIFLDQPVNVGFSYATGGATVDNSHASGVDVHAFFELFIKRFPTFAGRPLHISGESYAGHYLPNIASVLYKETKKAHNAATGINLASVLIGNGLTDPATQMAATADYVCDGPYPAFPDPDGPQCQSLRTKEPTCQRLLESCYRFNSKFTCVPALLYCNSQMYGPIMQTGLNPYDLRIKCNREENGDLCYKEMQWIDKWMNDPAHKVALGVDPELEFASCNMDVNKGFLMQGDGGHNSALLLPELIEDGVRVLIYAGNADAMCNYIGNERWIEALETSFKSEFASSPSIPLVTSGTGRSAGTVRSAGGRGFSAGNVTFVTIYEAGHMVPHDQPEAALDMFSRWISNLPLTVQV